MFLAALSTSLMVVFSFAVMVTRGANYVLDITSVRFNNGEFEATLMTFWLLAVLVAVSSVMSIVTIFLFNKRKLQITLSKLNLLLYLGVIFTVFYSAENALDFIKQEPPEAHIEYKIGAILPILSVILVFLASRAIKKDEELVRSADRIR